MNSFTKEQDKLISVFANLLLKKDALSITDEAFKKAIADAFKEYDDKEDCCDDCCEEKEINGMLIKIFEGKGYSAVNDLEEKVNKFLKEIVKDGGYPYTYIYKESQEKMSNDRRCTMVVVYEYHED